MQRAGMGLLAVLGLLAARPAYADCASDTAALQGRLPQVSDPRRREEVRLLLEKAAIDAQHGRGELCATVLQRAGKLLN